MANREDRAAWKAAREKLDALERERAAALAPIAGRLFAAEEELALAEEKTGGFLGFCEGCGEPIFASEPYMGGEDLLDLACAPTYADLLGNAGEAFTDADGAPMTLAARRQLYDEYIAAGGLPTDSMAI